MSRRRIVVPALLLALAVALGANAGPAVASSPNPARPPAAGAHAHRATAPGATITAVVVKSWGGCSSASLTWDDLNANWSSYGTIPISINYSDTDLCGSGTVTLAALEASGANVVILDGAILRKGCVVGACSLVRGELAAYGIYAGNPIEKIGERT